MLMRKLLIACNLLFAITQVLCQISVANPLLENKSNPLGIEGTPRFSWQIQSEQRNIMQTAYAIRVNDAPNKMDKSNVWFSGKITSDASQFVPYNGKSLESGKKYYWQVKVWDNQGRESDWSSVAFWQMGLLKKNDWTAQWIQSGIPEDTTNQPSPYFRKTFILNNDIKSATLFITSLGLYEAHINGNRVRDSYLTPGWTSYNKRLQYQQYDVAHLLSKGKNAIGVVLGNGWYRGFIGFGGSNNFYGHELAVLAQIEVTYTNGKSERISTNDSWKVSHGSILYSEIYNGEKIDARNELSGWDLASYNDTAWASTKLYTKFPPPLITTNNEPVRKHEKIKPIQIIKTPKGETVLDFGQNLVGWVELKISGKSGDKITLYHAEVLDKEGNFYTENLRPAKQMNEYILSGNGIETFEPHFTFQGFRYIKIEDYKGKINLEDFTAIPLYSDMSPTGKFTCSNELINQLQHNIQWGQRGNFLDVPTDCPQRDERLGWTGDAQAFSRTATFNFNVYNFFAKWLKDLAADQINGSVPFVVPNVLGSQAAGSAGWADAATIIPWNMYLAYGDKKVLEDQYDSMKSWVEYMESRSSDYLWNTGFHFGDWLFYRPFDDNDGRSAVTDKYLIAQCFFAHSTEILMKSADVLGKEADVRKYEKLLENIKNAFLKEYVTPNGRLVSSTQTAYVLALNFDMLPERLRKNTVDRLVENVISYDKHLTTGFLGTPYLCHVLSRFGHVDLAYDLLLQDTYPSWLYPVKMGATTIWERWDGIKPDGSFQTPGMNSFNHYAYGAIGDWMYRVMSGLDTDENRPGYKALVIKPYLNDRMEYASSEYNTGYGKAKSAWKKSLNTTNFDIEIPVNTTATIILPAIGIDKIKEGNISIIDLKD